jgi:ABC-2 type transport system permease protein
MIGVSTIGIEKQNFALNTLIVKPLFRDTIINGKMLGAIFFLIATFGMITLLYISGLFIAFGGYLAPYLAEFLIRIPIILIVSIACALVFLSISMLISILVRDQALAYIMGITLIIFDTIIKNDNFAGNIGYISAMWFGSNVQSVIRFVAGLSPTNLLYYMNIAGAYSPSLNLFQCTQIIEPYLTQLLLYLVVSVVLCYISFLRSDIS